MKAAASTLTAAAVNAGAVRQNEPQHIARFVPAMEQRMRTVLAVAAQGCDALVLGAWGCGVFRNDPAMIAALFKQVLAEPIVRGRFRHITFAVYDPAPQPATFRAVHRRPTATVWWSS